MSITQFLIYFIQKNISTFIMDQVLQVVKVFLLSSGICYTLEEQSTLSPNKALVWFVENILASDR